MRRWLYILISISITSTTYGQLTRDSISFEPLKEYVGKAQDSLLVHLDSIFAKPRVDLESGIKTMDDYKQYLKKSDLFFLDDISFDEKNNEEDSSTLPLTKMMDYEWIDLLDFNVEYFFDPRYSYHLKHVPDPKNPYSYRLLDDGRDSLYYGLVNTWLDTSSVNWFSDVSVYNSIVHTNLSARKYYRSILYEYDFRPLNNYWRREMQGSQMEVLRYLDEEKKGLVRDSIKKYYAEKIYGNSFVKDSSDVHKLEITESYIHYLRVYNDNNRPGEKYRMGGERLFNLEINKTKINRLWLDGYSTTKNLYIDYDPYKTNRIIYNYGSEFPDNPYTSNQLIVRYANVDEYIIGNKWENMIIRNTDFSKKLEIYHMPDTLVLIDVKAPRIDLRQEPRSNGEKSKVFIYNVDYDNLSIRWQGYEMYKPHESWTDDHMNRAYLELLDHFKKKGYADSYQQLNKEYKNWKYTIEGKEFISWLNANWWDYGYNRSLIFRNTIFIFLFYSLINAFFIRKLSKSLYEDERLHIMLSKNPKRTFASYLINIPAAIFYTSQIFFGVKFSYDKLKYSDKLKGFKILWLLYFFTIYLSGLICIAYIINTVVDINVAGI
ncbi:hypothetical protein [Marinoscillum sp.]|uniref:hypothetical protein n=1 Tax=Marinoscillum sp. TaxID=2024838 RepID=UPI003BAB74CE